MNSEARTYAAPFAVVSSTDRGGALLSVNIVGLIISLASVGVRIYISNRELDSEFALYKDDWLCFAGLATCIVEFALVCAGINHGNGKAMDQISPSNLIQLQQIQYASDIFWILSLLCSRASIILLYKRIQGLGSFWLWNAALAFLSIWAVACLFAVTLKCNLSQPWIIYNASCTGLLARWQAIQISSIIIEGAIFTLGVYLISIVSMKLSAKGQIITLFGTRVVVVIFSALCLAYLPRYFDSRSPTYAGIPGTIYALAAMYCSLVTATTPLLKSFIVKFGVLGAKPTVVVQVPLSSTAGMMEEAEAGEKAKAGRSRGHKKKKPKHPFDLDTETGDTHVSRSTDCTVSKEQPWNGHDNHSYADTITTPKSEDDGSDRKLQAVRTDASTSTRGTKDDRKTAKRIV